MNQPLSQEWERRRLGRLNHRLQKECGATSVVVTNFDGRFFPLFRGLQVACVLVFVCVCVCVCVGVGVGVGVGVVVYVRTCCFWCVPLRTTACLYLEFCISTGYVQCTAFFCRGVQRGVVWSIVLPCVAECVLQYVLQCVASSVCDAVCVAVCCNVLLLDF